MEMTQGIRGFGDFIWGAKVFARKGRCMTNWKIPRLGEDSRSMPAWTKLGGYRKLIWILRGIMYRAVREIRMRKVSLQSDRESKQRREALIMREMLSSKSIERRQPRG